MHNHLPKKIANYTAEELKVIPQNVMTEVGDKRQIVHEFDDGTVGVVPVSDQTYFNVTLEWTYLSQSDCDLILDFWHNPVKANGRARTFYWRHPIDSKDYVVRFQGPLSKNYSTGLLQGITSCSLRVEGVRDV